MSIVMPEEKPYELPPPGARAAVCYLVVDLGTQETSFGAKRMLYIGWELTEEHRESDGKPFTVGRRYNYSSNAKSSLRGDVEGWLGRPLSAADFGQLDLAEFLGKTCILGIKLDENTGGKVYANIGAVLKPGKGMPERMPPSFPGVALSLDDRPFDHFRFEQLPSWLKEVIQKSPEYTAAVTALSPGQRYDEPAPSDTPAKKRMKAMLKGPVVPEPLSVELDDELPY